MFRKHIQYISEEQRNNADEMLNNANRILDHNTDPKILITNVIEYLNYLLYKYSSIITKFKNIVNELKKITTSEEFEKIPREKINLIFLYDNTIDDDNKFLKLFLLIRSFAYTQDLQYDLESLKKEIKNNQSYSEFVKEGLLSGIIDYYNNVKDDTKYQNNLFSNSQNYNIFLSHLVDDLLEILIGANSYVLTGKKFNELSDEKKDELMHDAWALQYLINYNDETSDITPKTEKCVPGSRDKEYNLNNNIAGYFYSSTLQDVNDCCSFTFKYSKDDVEEKIMIFRKKRLLQLVPYKDLSKDQKELDMVPRNIVVELLNFIEEKGIIKISELLTVPPESVQKKTGGKIRRHTQKRKITNRKKRRHQSHAKKRGKRSRSFRRKA